MNRDMELPGGFQDADFEMRDLMAAGRRIAAARRKGLCAHGWRQGYPGHPVAGIFMMTLFTTFMSFPMAYCRFKSKTILGPSALHGMFNPLGMLTAFFVVGANPLFGFVAGIAGVAVTLLLTLGIYFFDKKFIENYQTL